MLKENKNITIFADGGSRGNPGPSGIGVVIYNSNNKIILKDKKFIGQATNNQAEYQAVILSLEHAKKLHVRKIKFVLDSELIVNQLKGIYRVKNYNLKPLYQKVLVLLNNFEEYSFSHILRDGNKLADKLVNEALDERL